MPLRQVQYRQPNHTKTETVNLANVEQKDSKDDAIPITRNEIANNDDQMQLFSSTSSEISSLTDSGGRSSSSCSGRSALLAEKAPCTATDDKVNSQNVALPLPDESKLGKDDMKNGQIKKSKEEIPETQHKLDERNALKTAEMPTTKDISISGETDTSAKAITVNSPNFSSGSVHTESKAVSYPGAEIVGTSVATANEELHKPFSNKPLKLDSSFADKIAPELRESLKSKNLPVICRRSILSANTDDLIGFT